MRLRYTGEKPLRFIHGKQVRDLKKADVVDVDPWKIRRTRLVDLFEVAHTGEITKMERRFLATVRGRLKGAEELLDKEVKAEL